MSVTENHIAQHFIMINSVHIVGSRRGRHNIVTITIRDNESYVAP